VVAVAAVAVLHRPVRQVRQVIAASRPIDREFIVTNPNELDQCRKEVDEAISRLHEKVDGFSLREEQIEAIAERASDRAVEKMTTYVYLNVGKGVVTKVFKIIGIIFLGLAVSFHDKWLPK
jgi:hypothetical protein